MFKRYVMVQSLIFSNRKNIGIIKMKSVEIFEANRKTTHPMSNREEYSLMFHSKIKDGYCVFQSRMRVLIHQQRKGSSMDFCGAGWSSIRKPRYSLWWNPHIRFISYFKQLYAFLYQHFSEAFEKCRRMYLNSP